MGEVRVAEDRTFSKHRRFLRYSMANIGKVIADKKLRQRALRRQPSRRTLTEGVQ